MTARLCLAAVAAAGILAGCALPEPAGDARAERLMRDLSRHGLFQGAVVIGREGRFLYRGAFGMANLEANMPFAVDTPSDTGSLAKTFTATALLELAGDGRVDLEAPVQRYLPDFPHAATKVRHLISHTAGLPTYAWFEKASPPGTVLTNAVFVSMLVANATAPAFAPGSRFEYDNVSYDLAALVLERVTGMRYEDHLRERYFAPLGMRGAFVRPARFDEFRGVRTRGYRHSHGTWVAADAIDGEGFHGGGNIYLSASDLHQWADAHARQVVPTPRAASWAFAPARLDDGRATGLSWASWYLAHDRRRGYYVGDHEGFHAFCYWDKDRRIAIAFVSNGGMPPWLKPALARALVAIAEGRPHEALSTPEALDLPAESMEGRWVLSGAGLIGVKALGRRRILAAPSGVEYPMFRVGAGTFYVPGLDAYIAFERSPDGDATLVWSSVFVHTRATRSAPRSAPYNFPRENETRPP